MLAPTVNPAFAARPTVEFAACNNLAGTMIGMIPLNAGYHNALSIPNMNPLKHKSGIDAWLVKKDSALMPTKMLPTMSVMPTNCERPNRSAATPPTSMNNTRGII